MSNSNLHQYHPTVVRLAKRIREAYSSKAKTIKSVLAVIRTKGLPPENPPAEYVPRNPWVRVAIDDDVLAQAAYDYCVKKYPRKKLITYARPTIRDGYCEEYREKRYKGKHRGRSSTEILPRYSSFVRIARVSRKAAELWQDGKFVCKQLAPAGLRWGWDHNGAFLVDKNGFDYHMTVEEFRSKRFATIVKRNIREKKRKHKAAELELKRNAKLQMAVEKAMASLTLLAKYWVTPDDSYAAGNCQVGTSRFIANLERYMGEGIGAVRADYLIKKWDEPAVRRTVRTAVTRQLKRKFFTEKQRQCQIAS